MNYFAQQKQNKIKKENQETIGLIALALTAIFFAITVFNFSLISYDTSCFNLTVFVSALILFITSGSISLYFLNK